MSTKKQPGTGVLPGNRTSTVCRKTKETDITIKINLDGTGNGRICTGIPFMDHMLQLFAKTRIFRSGNRRLR